jgi:hypothetical protein
VFGYCVTNTLFIKVCPTERNSNASARLVWKVGLFRSRLNRAWISAVEFNPEVIEIMSAALEASIERLPEPVSLTQVYYLAESILHTAEAGERDAAVLERIALVELRMSLRE